MNLKSEEMAKIGIKEPKAALQLKNRKSPEDLINKEILKIG